MVILSFSRLTFLTCSKYVDGRLRFIYDGESELDLTGFPTGVSGCIDRICEGSASPAVLETQTLTNDNRSPTHMTGVLLHFDYARRGLTFLHSGS